jgi:oxygen-independent coproporphyrinogen-3 oxidase
MPLRDKPLADLGRRHTVDEAIAAVRIAQSVFERSSFDLIYGRPNQTLEDWEDELKEGLWLAQGHISLYMLTIEQGTRYFDLHKAGKLIMPNEDLAADFYELTQELTAQAGMPAYEISNHARPGQESEHNLLYWRYGEYAGIGPGAHGRLLINNQRHATATEKMPFDWQKKVVTNGHGLVTDDVLTWEEQGDEFLVMGLRLREGISPQRFTALSGRKINQRQIDDLKGYGFVETLPNGNIRVTDRGWPVLDAVVADLAA